MKNHKTLQGVFKLHPVAGLSIQQWLTQNGRQDAGAPRRLRLLVAFSLALFAFTGCESTDSGGSVSGSVYYGSGFSDPWYYGDIHDDVDIIVTPPDRPDSAPPRPTHPIVVPPAPRPTPMPSIPRTPMPSPRVR